MSSSNLDDDIAGLREMAAYFDRTGELSCLSPRSCFSGASRMTSANIDAVILYLELKEGLEKRV